jgi:hypothetical protein
VGSELICTYPCTAARRHAARAHYPGGVPRLASRRTGYADPSPSRLTPGAVCTHCFPRTARRDRFSHYRPVEPEPKKAFLIAARAWEVNWDNVDASEPGYLNNADLLSWLGVTRSPAIAYVPTPLYMRHQNEPYWLEVLARQRAVYLKYNHCLASDGFQKLAARAIAVLQQHPGYRLIVDLRDNGGGDSAPFGALIADIVHDPAVNVRGRIFGLVNGFTDSSATVDAYHLQSRTNALLVGQQVADPIDEFGNNNGLLRLPYYGMVVQYTTAVINPRRVRFGIPSIVVAPTVRDLLTGTDPVLAAALDYRA